MFYTLQAVVKGKTNQAWVSHGLSFKMFSYLKPWKYVKTHIGRMKFTQGEVYVTVFLHSVHILTFHYFWFPLSFILFKIAFLPHFYYKDEKWFKYICTNIYTIYYKMILLSSRTH